MRASRSAEARLWSRMGVLPHPDECWLWPGALSSGYGHVRIGRRGEGARVVHAVAWESFYGEIPTGMELDHRCHTDDPSCSGGETCAHRRCVNPHHLEPVTPKENSRRAVSRTTHCPQGHEYSEENTAHTSGRRVCIACRRAHGRKYARRRREARGRM